MAALWMTFDAVGVEDAMLQPGDRLIGDSGLEGHRAGVYVEQDLVGQPAGDEPVARSLRHGRRVVVLVMSILLRK
jgi:hypothetical protein